ncbi:Uncharacterised protein [Escherichia coli]|nr:Uncharacterised protein [Escherichia coli]
MNRPSSFFQENIRLSLIQYAPDMDRTPTGLNMKLTPHRPEYLVISFCHCPVKIIIRHRQHDKPLPLRQQ